MIEKLLIIIFLLSPTGSTSSLIEINKSLESPEASQLNPKIPDNSLLIKRLKKQITKDNYNLTREAYEREVNESIADYYAQRKAVMDRYHARQKEISERFGKRQQTTASPYVNDTDDVHDESSRINNDKTSNYPLNDANNADSGYHRIGERTHSSDETVVYQHNIGVGVNGQSQLEAVFEVLLDDGIRINCIELTPKGDSNASIRIVRGGPGQNEVKLILTPKANRGFSYNIKIWGYRAFTY